MIDLSDFWIAIIAGVLIAALFAIVLRTGQLAVIRLLDQLSAKARLIVISAFLVLPFVAGMALTTLMMMSDFHLPFDLMVHHCHSEAAGCSAHERVVDFLPLTATGAGLVALIGVWWAARLYDRLQASANARRNLELAVLRKDGWMKVLEMREPMAFCAGIFSPRIYVTSGLLEALSSHDLDIVRRHEEVHIRRGDLILRLLVSVFAVGQFSSVRSVLLHRLINTQEELCDREVAHEFGALNTAEALVRVQRLRRSAQAQIPGFSVAMDDGDVEARTRALVAFDHQSSSLTIIGFWVISAVLGLSLLVASEPLHHAIETFFLSLKG